MSPLVGCREYEGVRSIFGNAPQLPATTHGQKYEKGRNSRIGPQIEFAE
jgi:hypothetical protein